MVGIFPYDQVVIRFPGALLPAENDQWLVQRGGAPSRSIALVLAGGRLWQDALTQRQAQEETVALNAAWAACSGSEASGSGRLIESSVDEEPVADG